MYVGDYLARRCVYDADAVALVDVSGPVPVRHTYGELDAIANQTAAWLQRRGVAKGDRVGYLGMDWIEAYTLFFACCKMGAIFAPLNWRLHSREVESMVDRLDPKVIVCDEADPIPAIAEHLYSADAPPITLDEAVSDWAAGGDDL